MIHPDTELRFINQEIGYGVVATKRIPAGTITWVLDRWDREFTPEEVQELPLPYQNILDTYSYRNNKGNFVLCWDLGRYVNHSFNANCLSTAYDFELAIRDIRPGEQLTDDYGYLNITLPFRAANEGTRRKVVYPDDLPKYHRVWDNKIKKVFPAIPRLEQPLGPMLPREVWERIEAINNGGRELDSILCNFYTGRVNGTHVDIVTGLNQVNRS